MDKNLARLSAAKHPTITINRTNVYQYNNIMLIVNRVAQYYNVSTDEIMRHTRKQPNVTYRQIAMWFAVRTTKMSFIEIGEFFELDHATVSHSCKQINNMITTNKYFSFEIKDLMILLGSKVVNRDYLNNIFSYE